MTHPCSADLESLVAAAHRERRDRLLEPEIYDILRCVGIGYLLYRGLVGGVGSSLTSDRALEELRVAYARGDLSDEEFEERRAKLTREESQ